MHDTIPTLEILNQFDDFKASINNMADFGCGAGKDLSYWANMREWTADGEPGRYLNFQCIGYDIDCDYLKPDRDNIEYRSWDLNSHTEFSEKYDIAWCNDVLQYIHSPIEFLGRINRAMNTGGLLYLAVPSTVNVYEHRFQHYTPSGHVNTFTVTQVIYLLALNGFDVKDFYLQKLKFDDWIQVLIYKDREPIDYNTSWYSMVDQDILNDNMKEIVLRNNTLSDQGLITQWIDGTVHDYRWHTS